MKVVFVCTGNTCRSPMAEAILTAKQLPGVEVRSAGIFASAAPLSRNARAVLDERGIAFDHSAKALEASDIRWASLVLAMTESHKAILMANFPEAADKIFTLKEFADGGPGDVQDPYGGNLSAYTETYEQLDALIHRLVDKLKDL